MKKGPVFLTHILAYAYPRAMLDTCGSCEFGLSVEVVPVSPNDITLTTPV